jgi:hypothetical protein
VKIEELIEKICRYDNPWTIENVQERIEGIMTEGGYGADLAHGVPHVKRMREYYKLLFPDNFLLEIAIYFHDIGRVCKGNHAENSALAFWNAVFDGLSLSKEDYDCIYYAIRYHSVGLSALGVKKARTRKDILLGFLCLIDHLDALGPEGRFRTMIWSKERNLGFYNRDLYNSSLYRAVIDGSARLTPHEMDSLRKSKTKSFLEHFLYNLLATEQSY